MSTMYGSVLRETNRQGFSRLRLDRCKDRLHAPDVLVEGAAAGGGNRELGPRDAAIERLVAADVLRLFELACVDAQIAVGRLQQLLQLVERQPLVDRQRADDAQPEPLMDETLQAERCVRCRLDWRLHAPRRSLRWNPDAALRPFTHRASLR